MFVVGHRGGDTGIVYPVGNSPEAQEIPKPNLEQDITQTPPATHSIIVLTPNTAVIGDPLHHLSQYGGWTTYRVLYHLEFFTLATPHMLPL